MLGGIYLNGAPFRVNASLLHLGREGGNLSILNDIDSCLALLEKIKSQLSPENAKPKKPGMYFEQLYKLYPRKMGKKEGINRARRKIKTESDYNLLRQSIINYAQWCDDMGQSQKFIMHFSRFLNVWEDWQVKPETDQDVMRRKREYRKAQDNLRTQESHRHEQAEKDNPKPSPEKVREYIKGIAGMFEQDSDSPK